MKHLHLPIRCVFVLLLALCSAPAQSAPPSDLSMDALATRAGIIFSGTVEKIDASGDSIIHITFSVDQGIRGAFSGQILTLNEWRGSAGAHPGMRYREGERLLVFFYLPSQNGLTSPVGGSAGLFRFAGPDTLTLTEQQAGALQRAVRLRAAMSDSATPRTVPAADLLRALRLVTSLQ